jgi:hypothetical protein
VPDVERQLLEAMLRSLGDDQMRALSQVLRVEQVVALATLRDRLTRSRTQPAASAEESGPHDPPGDGKERDA